MFDDDNYYDYDSIAKDADDLYFDEYDSWDDEAEVDNVEQNEWENYYHNLADEIIED